MSNPIPPPTISASTTATTSQALLTPRVGRRSCPQLGQKAASAATGAWRCGQR